MNARNSSSTLILLAVNDRDADVYLTAYPALRDVVRVVSPASRSLEGALVHQVFATNAALGHPQYRSTLDVLRRSSRKTRRPEPVVG